MKAGKLPQAVWMRSVQKQLNPDKEAFLFRPSKEEMCTAIPAADGVAALTASSFASGNALTTGIYAAAKAANDLASRGAEPEGIAVQIILPLDTQEDALKETVRHIEKLCRKLHIPMAGIQVESSAAVRQMTVYATALGKAKEEALLRPAGAAAGQDIVLCGYIGLEGMLRILDECEEELKIRFSPGFLRRMRSLEGELLRVDAIRIAWNAPTILGSTQDSRRRFDSPEAASQAELLAGSFGGCPEGQIPRSLPQWKMDAPPACRGGSDSGRVTAMQQIGSGGIFGTLWELAEAAGVGLEVDLKKMSIRQETVEVCEYYHLNPYRMTSTGAVLMIAEHGERLIQTLQEEGVRASMLGVTTAGNARVVTSEGERRFLDRPAPDELMRWWEERMA